MAAIARSDRRFGREALLDLARGSTRQEFVAACPFPVLVGSDTLEPPARTRGTVRVEAIGDKPVWSYPAEESAADATMVLPVRKTQDSFPSMITVGRTANNDLVVPDASVSRLHAWFRLVGTRIELSDAGSRNGTTVGGRPLPARCAPCSVHSGDRLCFGRVCFTLLDAGALWDRLRSD